MKAQAGNVTLVAGLMTAVGGLVAAALVVGAPVLSTVIDAETGESGLPPDSRAAAHDPAPPAAVPMASRAASTQGAERSSATDPDQAQQAWLPGASTAAPWPFEQRAPGPQAAPGKKRPDRLSAPEGWPFDGSNVD